MSDQRRTASEPECPLTWVPGSPHDLGYSVGEYTGVDDMFVYDCCPTQAAAKKALEA